MARRLRLLCLHGFRTSGHILNQQIELAGWGDSVQDLLDLSFLDGPFPAEGASNVEGRFPPPYYEWYSTNLKFTEYYGVEQAVSYISDYMKLHGPFDGLLGFSQGGFLAGALAGYQFKENLLPTPIKFVIILAGGIQGYKGMSAAYEKPIKCPSLHTIGSRDFNRAAGEALIKKFENPVVLRHPDNHRVPRLDEAGIQEFRSFLLRMQEVCSDQDPNQNTQLLQELQVSS